MGPTCPAGSLHVQVNGRAEAGSVGAAAATGAHRSTATREITRR